MYFGFIASFIVTFTLGVGVGRGEVAIEKLPDFSCAGYHSGDADIPAVATVTDVTKFGAKGDGRTDDTDAFLAAVRSVKGVGAVFVPPGQFVITGVLKFEMSGVVLRGAGVGKTVLVMPKSLEEIAGGSTASRTTAPWSFTGGFIEVRGKPGGTFVAGLAKEARRGDRTLTLEAKGSIKKGDWIRVLSNNAKSLGQYLHGGQEAGTDTFRYRHFVDWVAKVEDVAENSITLDRALRVDLKREWDPTVWSYKPGIEEVGVEGITFRFSGRAKRPHLKEEGFNAIYFEKVDNCWVKACEFIDADNAVNIIGSRFVTVENVAIRADKRNSPSGHHALWVRSAQDCLFRDFLFQTQYEHDLSVEAFASGNVFERGRGEAICFDHHGDAPYENLFTDIDVGDIKRLWNSGGSADRLPHSGVRTVVWNVRYQKGTPPRLPDWAEMIVVGVMGYRAGAADQVVDEVTAVVSLREAQRSKKFSNERP